MSLSLPSRAFRSPILLVALSVICLVYGRGAWAQTGSFIPYQNYFTTSIGSDGISTDATVTNFLVDRDGDGMLNGPADTSHPIPSGLYAKFSVINLHMSPSQSHAIFTGTGTSASGHNGEPILYIYSLPATDGAPLTLELGPIAVDSGFAREGFFDHPGWPGQKIYFVVDRAFPSTLDQRIHWFDLNSGTHVMGPFAFGRTIGGITFSPSGIAALVQYETSDGDNLSNYQLIKLCTSTLGTTYNPGGTSPGLGPGVATGNVTQIGPDLIGEIVFNDNVEVSVTLDDCTVSTPTGACCYSDGSCADGLTQSECEGGPNPGVYQGDGSDCAGSSCGPPPLELVVTGSGPASITGPGNILYTIHWENVGGPSTATTGVDAHIPAGTTYVSGSTGVFYNSAGQTVSWTLGSVAAGASGDVSFLVDAPCGVSSASLSNYNGWSFTTPYSLFPGTPSVVTNVDQPASGPLAASVSSVSDAGGALLRDGTATHTITLTNATAENYTDVHFEFWVGAVWQLDGIVDDGGGTITNPSARRFVWDGAVPPSSQRQIVFQTRVPACTNASSNQDALNYASSFDITNPCGDVLATLTPANLPITGAPLNVQAAVLSGTSVTQPLNGSSGRLIRAGTTVEFEMQCTNVYPVAVSNVILQSQIPNSLTPSANPPWTSTPPAGASWDSLAATVSWSGTLAPGETVQLRWAADVSASGVCSFQHTVDQSSGNCASDPPVSMFVLVVPEWGAEAQIIGSTSHDGLFRYRPGVDTSAMPLLCAYTETTHGLGLAPNGDLWAAGYPIYRFSPQNLELEFFTDTVFGPAGFGNILDIAISDDGNTVYLAGREYNGGTSYARIVAWDRTTDQFTPVLTEDTSMQPVYLEITHLDVAQDGFLLAACPFGILRIDPANPSSPQFFTDAAVTGQFWAFAEDLDGDILLTSYASPYPAARPLWSIDPLSGTFSTEIADLNVPSPFVGLINGATVDDSGNLWLSQDTGTFYLLDRSTPSPTLSSVNAGGFFQRNDLVWLPGSTSTAIADPGPGIPPAKDLQLLLGAPSPNPFNPRTNIAFEIPRSGRVRLVVHDVRGRRVRVLLDEVLAPGRYSRTWNGQGQSGGVVASGVYFARLECESGVRTQRMVLLK